MNTLHATLPAVESAFTTRFGAKPQFVVRAPGRVNLIGEHTDYNDGFVLPMAIEREVRIALRPRNDRRVFITALDYSHEAQIELDHLDREVTGWAAYVQGTAWALQSAGNTLNGWEGMLAGDVPLGAGLSSSAALELACARAFAEVSGFAWDAAAMAKAGQQAENGWVGVQCGIMDQMISAVGQKGHAVLIDCRTLDTVPVAMPAGLSVVILDTGTRRGLVDSAYNKRRLQCEAAAEYFGVSALRDIDSDTFVRKAGGLDELTRRRARHVITENERVIEAADALREGEPRQFGTLMRASHASLRDDFEVSSAELNAMVERADREDGCFGARMTGAGFGGCAVALVEEARAATFAKNVANDYRAATGQDPAAYITTAAEGASRVR